MFCPNCGQENKTGAKFCKSCGKPLKPVRVSPVEKEEEKTIPLNTVKPEVTETPSVPEAAAQTETELIPSAGAVETETSPEIPHSVPAATPDGDAETVLLQAQTGTQEEETSPTKWIPLPPAQSVPPDRAVVPPLPQQPKPSPAALQRSVVPVPVAVPPAPAEKRTGKKRGRAKKVLIITAIVIFIAAVGTGAFFGLQHMNVKKSYDSQISIGESYLKTGDYQKAADAFAKAVDLMPKEETGYLYLADAYVGQKDYSGATDTLQKALDLTGSEAIRQKLEKISEQSGSSGSDDSSGVKTQSSLSDSSADVESEFEDLMSTANAAYGKRDYGQAITALNRAKTLRPSEEAPYLLLSNVYADQGDLDKAAQVLQDGYVETSSSNIMKRLNEIEDKRGGSVSTGGSIAQVINGNVLNGSCAFASDGWIYFTSNDSSRIKKLQISDGKLETLNTSVCAWITVTDGWVYYVNASDGGCIYKMRTDGSSQTKLNSQKSSYLYVSGDWIYFLNNRNIWKIKTDGTGAMKMTAVSSSCINVVDEWIYYVNNSDGNSVYKVKTDGSNGSKVSPEKAEWMNVDGGWIYYSNENDGNALYKMGTDGGNKAKLNSTPSEYVNVNSGVIRFIDTSKGSSGFYQMNTDGSQLQKISSESGLFVVVMDNWIYYSNSTDSGSTYRMQLDGSNNQKVT